DRYALRAHAERLGDVGAAAEAGIDQDRHGASRLDDLRQSIDARAAEIAGTAAVVGDDDSVIAVLGGELGILPGEDALEHHLHLGEVADALELLPRQGGCRDAGEPRQVHALIHRPAFVVGREAAAVMALGAVARIGPRQAPQRLLIAGAIGVDRYCNRDGALLLRALDMMLGNLELVGRVELVPDRLAAVAD